MVCAQNSPRVIGRFAPSPSGPLHFGSLVAAIGSYCLARQVGGAWLVRIEDLDTPRVVPGAADHILRTLEACGLEWDGPVLYQSRRTDRYQAALDRLQQSGLLFTCGCSRKEVLASAPHVGEEGPVYAGVCRVGLAQGRRPRSLRIRVPQEQVCFVDGVFGAREQRLESVVGDFVLRRADGLFAYQLAVVVDDAESGVNQVVRGADLLISTPRQIFLQSCLGYSPPEYIHLPLALAPAGEKISKRHGAAAIATAQGRARELWRALHFLGQSVPEELQNAAAPEIVAWGIKYFNLQQVPTNFRVADD